MKTNVKRGIIPITLDKERTLFYDLNALVALEEQGVDIAAISEGVKMSQVRGILWAGLIHEDKGLTLEDVGTMVTFDNINEVSEAIGKAFSANGKK